MDPRVTQFIVMAVLVGCFSVLFPHILWPMLKTAFSSEKPQPQYDPRGPGPNRPSPGPGYPPGMRPQQAQAPRPQQGTPTTGGKGGYLGFVLPMYAVGISMYLIFTLFKIFISGGPRGGAVGGSNAPPPINKNLDPASQAELSHSIREVDRYLRMTDGVEPKKRSRIELDANKPEPLTAEQAAAYQEHQRAEQAAAYQEHQRAEQAAAYQEHQRVREQMEFEDQSARREREFEEPRARKQMRYEEQRGREEMVYEPAASAAAAAAARLEERERREEMEKRQRVTEMLYDLKQDAEAQGEELRRHLGDVHTNDSIADSVVQERELRQLQSRLERTEKTMAQILAAMGKVPDDLDTLYHDDDEEEEGDEEEEEDEDYEEEEEENQQQQQLSLVESRCDDAISFFLKKSGDLPTVFPGLSTPEPSSFVPVPSDVASASPAAAAAAAMVTASSEVEAAAVADEMMTAPSVTSARVTAASLPVVSIRALEQNLDHQETVEEKDDHCRPEMTTQGVADIAADVATNDVATADVATADVATADVATADVATADVATDFFDHRNSSRSESLDVKAEETKLAASSRSDLDGVVVAAATTATSPEANGKKSPVSVDEESPLIETVEKSSQSGSVQSRKPASRSTSLLTQTSPDRDSLDENVAAAWESMFHDYSNTNVETVGVGIDTDKLRARVLRGVDEDVPEEKNSDVGIDLDQFRARVLGGVDAKDTAPVVAATAKPIYLNQEAGLVEKNDDVVDDDIDDDDDDDDLYENDSVEMGDEEKKEIEMADSLLEDDLQSENDKKKTTTMTTDHQNSPVLRMNFTAEEVENLRQRVGTHADQPDLS